MATAGVTAPKGFVASGVHAGIRRSSKDLAVFRSEAPSVGAAMFSRNKVQAACLLVNRDHVAQAEPQAVVVNSGVANSATGERGKLDALATAAEAARLLELQTEQVIVLSTGVIGVRLPLDRLLTGLRTAVPAMSVEGGDAAAEAIMTTDTKPKTTAISRSGFTVGGMAKGAGMIHPDLATMLGFVTTDYPLEPGEAIEFLRPAVDSTFNAISVDGDCSTNDTVLLMANGASGITRSPATDEEFRAALQQVCEELAHKIVEDGEGVTVIAEIAVTGAASRDEAKAIARRIATSPLVKTALFGHDPNWGRVLMAVGSAPYNGGYADVDVDRLTLSYNGTVVVERGAPQFVEPDVSGPSCTIDARPRPRDGQRELSHDRPLLRLRPHQRGVHDVKPLLVLKCGGAVAGGAAEAILAFAKRYDIVVVHGAGPQISERMRERGLEVKFVDGRRYTSEAALEIVRESLAQVNASLCAAIGPQAIGFMGDDIGLEATQVSKLGLVGDPAPSRPALVVSALRQGRVPVIAPLAKGPLNVNADEAAVALAAGLGAERILFATDVPGLLIDGDVVASIGADEADQMLDAGTFEGGIVPKLQAAVRAARLGMTAEIGETAVTA